MSVTSDVEMGSGVSSSAALECAVIGALTTAAGLRGRPHRAGPHRAAGRERLRRRPHGMMDQLASLCGEPRKALMIDFREPTVRPVAFDPEALGCCPAADQFACAAPACGRRVCVAPGVMRTGGGRPRSVVAAGGSGSWRGGAGRGGRPCRCAPRAPGILTDNPRVLDVVAALQESDFTAIGRLFTASQASMRDDFEITTDHIDLIADTAVAGGRSRRTDDRRRVRRMRHRPCAGREGRPRRRRDTPSAVADRRHNSPTHHPHAGRPRSRASAGSGASERGPHQAGAPPWCVRPA